jgi:putative SOS response-associated peptidase YedK
VCGRFTLMADLKDLQSRFGFMNEDFDYARRYNVAPTNRVLTVLGENGDRTAAFMRWGLVPRWAKDIKIGSKMINARAEGLEQRSAFRGPFQRKRCLVLADGFYEWRREGKLRIPLRFVLRSREPFAFAGLWDSWENKETGDRVRSCTIVTTEPNELVQRVHDRMPVILSEEAERLWLDQDVHEPSVLNSVLTPFPAGSMEAYEVSPRVNSPKDDAPDLIEAVKPGPPRLL